MRASAIVAFVAIATMLVAWFGSGPLLPDAALLDALQLRVSDIGAFGALLFVGAYAAAVLAFAPASIFTVAAGALYGYWGIPLSLAGALLGATLAFAIARRSLRSRFAFMRSRRSQFLAVDRATTRLGWRAVLLVRLSPLIPFSIQNYLFGMTAVRWRGYVLASLVGMLPATFVKIGLGMAASGAASFTNGPATAALIIAVPASIALPWIFMRTFRQETAALERAAQDETLSGN